MLTAKEKIALVERALYEAIVVGEGAELLVSESWVQRLTPGPAPQHHNQVFRSILAEDEADARIAATIAAYRALGVSFLWTITPSSMPADLGDRLCASGFRLAHVGRGMVADPGAIRVEPGAGVTVEPLSHENLDDWVRVHAAGWELPDGASAELRAQLRRGLGSEACVMNLLARVDGTPAGTGSVQLCEGFAHLRGGIVLPEHRRRGIFRSLIAARLRILRDRGIDYVTVHGMRDTSAPILEAMGFEAVCDILYYSYSQPEQGPGRVKGPDTPRR